MCCFFVRGLVARTRVTCPSGATCLPTGSCFSSNSACWSSTKRTPEVTMSSKWNLFSSWYSWHVAHLALNNKHSLTDKLQYLPCVYKILRMNFYFWFRFFSLLQEGNSVILTRGIKYWGVEIGWSNVTTWEYTNRLIMKWEYWVTWILSLLHHKYSTCRLNYMFYNYYMGLCITTSQT